MNLLLPHIQVALRHCLKYKVQTLVSILSLAIGMVTLSVVHAVLQNFRLAEICSEPYYDRAYTIRFDSLPLRRSPEPVPLNGDIVRALKTNGGLRCIEQGPYAPNGLLTSGRAEFTYGHGERRKIQLVAMALDRHYPHFAGFRSAVTGEKIRVLKPHEALLSQSQARQIFGKVNPVGARVQLRRNGNSVQLTVADVYQDLSINERVLQNRALYFSPGELENMDFENYYALWVDVVLKDHATAKQLETEANARLKPLGLKAKVERLKETMGEAQSDVRMGTMVTYLIGSLILLAAIIGFLRMQTQLLWMRRREFALRITNGATRRQLFSMVATEMALMVGMACIVALAMDAWVYDFIRTRLSDFVETVGEMRPFYWSSIVIAATVLVLCLLFLGIILQRIGTGEQGLDSGMKRSHSHWFRNTMLGIQVVISCFFLCTTFDLLKLSSAMSNFNNIPQDARPYKESLYLRTSEADDKLRLHDALTKLPEVEKSIPYSCGFYRIRELAENETFCNDTWQQEDLFVNSTTTHYKTHLTADTSLLDYFHVRVKWKPKANRTKCILVNEALYRKMHQLGVAPNEMLTVEKGEAQEEVFPIAGTFVSMPYQSKDWHERKSFIVIDPMMRSGEDYILVPKPGAYKALKASVENTVRRLEPAVVKPMVFNLHDHLAEAMRGPEILQTVCSVLAVVSFAICLMSIFSTVMLDTRARKKEVAIRKVNGALLWDIAKLFGKTYALIVGIGVVFGVVFTGVFHVVVLLAGMSAVGVDPTVPILLGVLVIVLFISAIIAWQVRRIMQVDPSEILAKE